MLFQLKFGKKWQTLRLRVAVSVELVLEIFEAASGAEGETSTTLLKRIADSKLLWAWQSVSLETLQYFLIAAGIGLHKRWERSEDRERVFPKSISAVDNSAIVFQDLKRFLEWSEPLFYCKTDNNLNEH